jgi:outer membrane protein assembly factor BamA
MKRLVLLCLCTACATTEVVPSTVVEPTTATADAGSCPQQRPDGGGSAEAVLGKRISRVCVVGGRDDVLAALKWNEGKTLDGARTSRMLQELFSTGLVRDAEVIATPLDADNVVLTVFVTPYPPIAKISVVGASAVQADAFAELTPRRYANANPATLDALKKVVRETYEASGYPRATVVVAMEHDEAVVTVVEGTRDDVTRIRFTGLKRAKEAQLRPLLLSHEGDAYRADMAMRDGLQVQAYYLDHGMIRVSASPSYRDGELLFTVSEGDAFTIGALKLSGLTLTDSPSLLKSFESKRGALFSRTIVMRDIERVRDHASAHGTPVNVIPATKLDETKKTVDLTFELEPLTEAGH